jgi:hypothetical protein
MLGQGICPEAPRHRPPVALPILPATGRVHDTRIVTAEAIFLRGVFGLAK